MKNTCKKLVSVLLAFALIFTAVAVGFGSVKPTTASVQAPAQASSSKVSAVSNVEDAVALLTQEDSTPASAGGTLADRDSGRSPSIIIPGIGQSDVYLLDENGNRAVDADGKEIKNFPILIDTDYLLKTLVLPLAKMLITQKDNGFTDLAAQAVGKSLQQSAVDFNGQPVSKLELEKFPHSVAECTPEQREKIYKTIPLQDYTKVASEEYLYFFTYNSYGNNLDAAQELYDFIQNVKRETGQDKVNIVPISLGSTIATSLIEVYPQVKDDLDKIIFIVPALDGSRLVGDLYNGNLNTKDESLYKTLLPSLMGDTYTAYLINIILRIIPKQIILDLLDKIVDQLKEVMILNCTMIFGLVPSEDYPALAEQYLSSPERAEIRRQMDIYHRAQTNAISNLKALEADGVQVFDIVDYNFPLYSFVPSSETHNGDGLIHLDSSSMGSTSGMINTPLPDGYVQQNTHCTVAGHKHISPDGIVDASTGAFPETTFYFYNQDHEGTGRNDVIMRLAAELMLYDDLVDVWSMPERFPQFNVGREGRELRNGLLPRVKLIDQSTLSAEDAAELQAAIDQCEAMLETTVVVYSEFTDAQTRLDNILIKIGEKEAPKEDILGKIATPICKLLSDALYKYWGARGFTDPWPGIGSARFAK